jgi:tripartite ATP-independent transporter DctM subunit
LMIVVALTGMVTRSTELRPFLLGLALVAATAAVLWFLNIFLGGAGNLNLILFFVLGTAACMLAGVPIAFAFGLVTVMYLLFATSAPLTVVVVRFQGGVSNQLLLSIPLFVFLGLMIEMTGTARAMVEFLSSLIGHVRGGLAYVLLGAMYLVSGISGAKAADMAAVAPVLFPEMQQRGAKGGELVALLATSAAMSETIPPSLVLITIGTVTGVSIASLFAGGLLPAFIVALALCVVAGVRSRNDDLSNVKRADVRTIFRRFGIALPALILPFVIRTAVVEGITTATEVSTIGIVYAAFVGIVFYRRFDWRRLYPMLVKSAALSGVVLFIVGMASAMSWGLTQSGFSSQLIAVMTHAPGGAPMFIALSIVAFIVFGSVLEGIPAIVLFGPLLFPIARAEGINDVYYAIVAILAMGFGLVAPPFGIGFYTACAIGRVPTDEAMRPMLPYLAALLFGIIIIAAVPWLSTGFLPVQK